MGKISIIRNVASPNFDAEEIPVQFLVMHYTACSVEKALQIFCDRKKKVCAHFVIGTDGSIYDLGNFWHGPIRRGAHAGPSVFEQDGQRWEKFNDFSIGVELVNFNGNFIDYTAAQYQGLVKLVRHLSSRFMAVNDPTRIVGHEHIAGFRGKADPGLRFDWTAFHQQNFPNQPVPERRPLLSSDDLAAFERSNGKIDLSSTSDDEWTQLSSNLENWCQASKAPSGRGSKP